MSFNVNFSIFPNVHSHWRGKFIKNFLRLAFSSEEKPRKQFSPYNPNISLPPHQVLGALAIGIYSTGMFVTSAIVTSLVHLYKNTILR
jgi:hypothetical protein